MMLPLRRCKDATDGNAHFSIKITFKDSKGGLIKTVEANEGDDILSIAHEYDVDLEGACEGSIACSTCHVILVRLVFFTYRRPQANTCVERRRL